MVQKDRSQVKTDSLDKDFEKYMKAMEKDNPLKLGFKTIALSFKIILRGIKWTLTMIIKLIQRLRGTRTSKEQIKFIYER